MAEFINGERVRYVGTRSSELIGAAGTVIEQTNPGNVDVAWDNGGRPRGVMPENLRKLTPAAPLHAALIGPVPVVTSPKHVPPFEADGEYVRDANGVAVAEGNSHHESYQTGDDDKIADVLAAALNAYFGVK